MSILSWRLLVGYPIAIAAGLATITHPHPMDVFPIVWGGAAVIYALVCFLIRRR